MEKRFSQWKSQCVKKVDLSKKGSVDEDIEHVVSLINSCEEYFTTSSCSGRLILINSDPDSSDVHKQNCVWLFVSHHRCTCDDLALAVSRSGGDAVFKFEPLVLHVQCRRLDDAQLMHSVAINSGFRNSGLTVSKTGKIIAAIRSTHSLEVPLSHRGKLLVEPDYIRFLTQVANQKMEENLRRIHRFYQNLQSALSTEKLQIPEPTILQEQQEISLEEDKDKSSVYQRRRKRERHHQMDCCHGDRSSIGPELEDCLDLFT